MTSRIQLEPEAQAFVEASARPPFLFDRSVEVGRASLDAAQMSLVRKRPVTSKDLMIEGSPSGRVTISILRPQNAQACLPVIVYIHGGGWVFGNRLTHDRLTRDLVVRAKAALVFPDYCLSPEAKYPTAIEEVYATVKWVAEYGSGYGLKPKSLVLAGDGIGGNMAAAVTLLCKERGGPFIARQLLFSPVTDAAFDTKSYHQFAEGYYLRRDEMMWCWNQYTTSPGERNEITASPLRASIEQLRGLPPALVITSEADVLRDEGEAYANKLREAGVRVIATRFQGTIHGSVVLNALSNTPAARGAIMLATAWLREGFLSLRLQKA